VVKVEDPRGGDYLRWIPPLAGEQSGAFHLLNRNKRSLALDLKAPGGAEVLVRLARRADVLVESFRPGVLERLGAGPALLRAANPRLVVCALSGYGQDGPYRLLAGHDLNYTALSGALALNGAGDAPVPLPVQAADLSGAWAAVAGILAALCRRGATGEGGVVDASMTEGVLGMMAMQLGMAWARGAPRRQAEELLSGAAACYRTYRTADGRFVALGALEPHFFRRFCEAAGRPELAPRQLDDGGCGPVEELTALFITRTRDAWAALGREHDVCLTPVLEGSEPEADPQLRARGAFCQVPTPWEGRDIPGLRTPVKVDGGQAPLRPAPRLGEHTAEVLAEWGFSGDEVRRLAGEGVVASAP
jgi:crotonobetainyl-CoA:carnitine CoA-transferase CaiB-like acyl-CoA transferase